MPTNQPSSRFLSRVDKHLLRAFSPLRFLLPVRKGHRTTKTLSRRDIKPVSGGTKVGMTNTSAAAFRRGHCILNYGVVMSVPEPAEAQHLLTLNEAARRLTISRRTLERLIAEWKFPHPVKINRSSRVLLSDLNAYIAKMAAGRPTG